jgi:hypothetical protein
MVDPPLTHTTEEFARFGERVRKLVTQIEQDLAILRRNSNACDDPTVSRLAARIGELAELINASPPPGARSNGIRSELLSVAVRLMAEVASALIEKF